MRSNQEKGFTLLFVICYLLLVKKLVTGNKNQGVIGKSVGSNRQSIRPEIKENLDFSCQRGIGGYILPPQGSVSVITLSFLTTLLTVIGLLGVSQAEELPGQLVPEDWESEAVEDRGIDWVNSANSQEVVTEGHESGSISDRASFTLLSPISVTTRGSNASLSSNSVTTAGTSESLSSNSATPSDSSGFLSSNSVTTGGSNESLSQNSVTPSGTSGFLSSNSVTPSGAKESLSLNSVTLAGTSESLSPNSVTLAGTSESLSPNSVTSAGAKESLSPNSVTTGGSNESFSLNSVTPSGASEFLSSNSVTSAGAKESLSLNSVTPSVTSGFLSSNSVTPAGTSESLSPNSVTTAGVKESLSPNSVTTAGTSESLSSNSATPSGASGFLSSNSVTPSGASGFLSLNSATSAGAKESLSSNSVTTAGTSESLSLNSVTPSGASEFLSSNSVTPAGAKESLSLNSVTPSVTSGFLSSNSVKTGGSKESLSLNSVTTRGTSESLSLNSVTPSGASGFLLSNSVKTGSSNESLSQNSVTLSGTSGFLSSNWATPSATSGFLSLNSVTPSGASEFLSLNSVTPSGASGFLSPNSVTPSGASGFLSPNSLTTGSSNESLSQNSVRNPEGNNNPSPIAEITLAADEVKIISPQPGTSGEKSTNLIVQYNINAQIEVKVNNKTIDGSIPNQIQRDEVQGIITQVWYNVPLGKGENIISVAAGNGVAATVKITVKQTAEQITIKPVGDPRITADGRSTINIEGQITNENGELIKEDALVTLTASAGKFVGADEDEEQLGFQIIAREGKFTAKLQSGLEAQKVRIRAAVESKKSREIGIEESPIPQAYSPVSEKLEAFTQVEFVTYLRPSIATGVIDFRIGAGGTNFFGSRRDFLNPSTEDGTAVDLRGSAFAMGKIGEWLFTGAYNSARPLNENCNGETQLFQSPQFCDQQYYTYGDSSTVDYLTPSKDSVYLRLERTSPVAGAEPDYVMWGDYNTTELARGSQEFTATSRALHGFKGNYNLGNLQLTALYSPDVQGFQRDAIAPDGTSGYYFLSRRLVIAGSENVYIETEELNRPGTVVERKALSRGPDYEIDYDRGTLLFRKPIRQTEFDLFGNSLIRKIVVTYQYEGNDTGDTNIYAGRLQYNLSQKFDRQSWIASSYWREDQGNQNFELYGGDFMVSLGKTGRIVGEYAHSSNESAFSGLVTGEAYRLEFNGNIGSSINGRAYYRSVNEGFANNATTSFTPGQTRYGANLIAKLGERTSFQAGFDREINFGTAPAIPNQSELFDLFSPNNIFNTGTEAKPGSRVDNSLTTIRGGIFHKIGAGSLSLEYVNRARQDNIGNTFTGSNGQFVSRLNIPITSSLMFRAQNELGLDNSDALNPNRTTVGLDWAVAPGMTLRLAHQFFDGGLLGENAITTLDTIMERKIGENTSLTSRYSIIGANGSMIGQGAVGLNHHWVITKGLRLDLGYERILHNILGETAAGPRFFQPYAVGQSASSLALAEGESYNVGIEYSPNQNFQASARYERQTGNNGNNTVFTAGAAGKITPALTALFRFQQASAASQLLADLDDTINLKVGLAYRDPSSDAFNALLRYEYRKNPSTIPQTLLFGSGTGSNDHVLSLEAIYAPSWRWELYGKYAMRQSTTDLAQNFTSTSMIYLTQLRATYRLGYRMDLAVEGRWIGQPSADFHETGFAVESGLYITPDLRLGLGYSFGSVDDRDFSGYRSNGGWYLNLTLKVNELLNGFGRQKVSPPQEREAEVKPVAETIPTTTDTSSIPQEGEAEVKPVTETIPATTNTTNP